MTIEDRFAALLGAADPKADRAAAIASELYPQHDHRFVVGLVEALTDPRLSDDDRARASMALKVLDRDNPPPTLDAFARFLEVQRPLPGARARGNGVDAWEDGPAKAEDLTARATRGPGFVAAADVMKAPPREEIVEGFCAAGDFVVLAGESGSGKSFVKDDLLAAVTAGAEWYGRATLRGSVASIIFEADAMSVRLQALAGKWGSLDGLFVLRASDPISPIVRGGLEEPSFGERYVTGELQRLAVQLAEAGRPPVRLVSFDTVRASLSGSEDSSETVSAYLRGGRRILAAVPTAAAILVHHSGWQDGEGKRKRERGSSAFRGNVDATLYLEAEAPEGDDYSEVYLALSTLKVRDAARRPPIRLVRRRVDVLGFDHRGEPLSSCIVVEDTRSHHDREAKAAEVEAESDRAFDVEVLRVIVEHPEATSRERIRTYLGAGKARVDAAVARLLRGRLVVEGKRGQPFQLTDEASAPSRTQPDSTGLLSDSVRQNANRTPDLPFRGVRSGSEPAGLVEKRTGLQKRGAGPW